MDERITCQTARPLLRYLLSRLVAEDKLIGRYHTVPDQFPELPTHLLLYEEGSWQQHKLDMSTMNTDPDNKQWLHVGWHIQSRSGQTFFRHQDLMIIESWLAEHNYVDTGDGAHYQKKTDRKPRKKK